MARRTYDRLPWVGSRYGKLVVISTDGPRATCLCDCGNTKTAKKRDIRQGDTKSCGCIGNGRHGNTECPGCGVSRDSTWRDGRCLSCANALQRKRYRPAVRTAHGLKRYGISLEQYEEMWLRQGGGCAICGGTEKRALAVDHDHATGKVRSLLCGRCNLALGYAQDNPDRLLSLRKYLLAHS